MGSAAGKPNLLKRIEAQEKTATSGVVSVYIGKPTRVKKWVRQIRQHRPDLTIVAYCIPVGGLTNVKVKWRRT